MPLALFILIPCTSALLRVPQCLRDSVVIFVYLPTTKNDIRCLPHHVAWRAAAHLIRSKRAGPASTSIGTVRPQASQCRRAFLRGIGPVHNCGGAVDSQPCKPNTL